MELPRPSLVKQLSLYLSPEGKSVTYLLADHTTGGVLRLTRAAAVSFHRFSRAAQGDSAARQAMTEDDAKLGFMTLQTATQIASAAQRGAQWFNPLSIHVELFDVGPYQSRLTKLAKTVFGPIGVVLFLVLALTAFSLGVRNDWSAATAFQTSMTIEAFLIFGLFAPFLKLIHELGHVLAATVCNVRVRMGGFNLIAFFPLPFVDCSHADLTAQRSQRILISGAGVLTDFAIGLIAFCLWHFIENKQTQDIVGYIFVFSTLNSLLFNGNPLMRLDGYFVFSDLLGRRNLGTDGAATKKSATDFVLSFGKKGAWPANRVEWGFLAYGIAAAVYKVLLLLGIMWITLPQFLGIGVVAVIWAFWAMFGAKWLGLTHAAAPSPAPSSAPTAAAPSAEKSPNGPALQTGLKFRWPIAAGAIAGVFGLAFVPIAPRTIIDLQPDLPNNYNVTNTRAGVLTTQINRFADVKEDAVLAQLHNLDFADAIELAELGLAEAQIINAIAQGKGAAQITAGNNRVAAAQELRDLATQEFSELTVRAPRQGSFAVLAPLRLGSFVAQGSVAGYILPHEGQVWMTGVFPESYVIHFDKGIKRADLWTGGHTSPSYSPIDPVKISLVEEVQVDTKTFSRGFTLRIPVGSPASSVYPQVRLAFSPIPIWQHVTLWGKRKLSQFRDAQLAETEKRIGN